jgi:hypothetical protein
VEIADVVEWMQETRVKKQDLRRKKKDKRAESSDKYIDNNK